jgi:hypothetical protein
MRLLRISLPTRLFVCCLLAWVAGAGCDEGRAKKGRDGGILDAAPVPMDATEPSIDAAESDAPPAPGWLATEILGLPTATSIAVSVVPEADCELAFEYGAASGAAMVQTQLATASARVPFVGHIAGLTPDTQYRYRVLWRAPGAQSFAVGPEHSFHTARAAGSPFTFTIQADPHLDENSNLTLYRVALANQLADAPDFTIDLGDTFMCEKHTAPFVAVNETARDNATVVARYLYERSNFGLVAHSVPLFLVNGNHEGENGWMLNGTAENLGVWATLARKAYYFAPVPDGFYGGSSSEEPFVGKRGSFYAWQWGDALFIVLDPFWFTMKKLNQDAWAATLGQEQYQWLGATLAASQARFRFVFIHNLVGGLDGQGRGGIEAVPFYEWGGANPDGSDGFAAHRPGWSKPIHQLLRDNHVTAVFHGHDHVYVKQELDGILYQELPQPSAANFNNGPTLATEGHYTSGTILSSAGHLRVLVEPAQSTVSYVRAYRPEDENGRRKNRDIADSTVLLPR